MNAALATTLQYCTFQVVLHEVHHGTPVLLHLLGLELLVGCKGKTALRSPGSAALGKPSGASSERLLHSEQSLKYSSETVGGSSDRTLFEEGDLSGCTGYEIKPAENRSHVLHGFYSAPLPES